MISGETVSKEVLDEVLATFRISTHGMKQLAKRTKFHNRYDILKALTNYILGYYNTDGTINVAITPFEYFVFGNRDGYWNLITFKENSWNGIDIFHKQKLAKEGKHGKYYYKERRHNQ